MKITCQCKFLDILNVNQAKNKNYIPIYLNIVNTNNQEIINKAQLIKKKNISYYSYKY